jgi:hypothetical protein
MFLASFSGDISPKCEIKKIDFGGFQSSKVRKRVKIARFICAVVNV